MVLIAIETIHPNVIYRQEMIAQNNLMDLLFKMDYTVSLMIYNNVFMMKANFAILHRPQIHGATLITIHKVVSLKMDIIVTIPFKDIVLPM